MVKIVPILLGVVASYLAAMVVDPAARANVVATVAAADWVGLPIVWEETALSIFNKDLDVSMLITAVITIAPISLATIVEQPCIGKSERTAPIPGRQLRQREQEALQCCRSAWHRRSS